MPAGKVLLFIDSASPVKLMPEWSTLSETVKTQWDARAKSGERFVYRHGSYSRIRMPVRFVSSADRSIVESWWISEADLFLHEESTSGVYSVHMMNDSHPIPTVQSPYTGQFSGVIELEGEFDTISAGAGTLPIPLREPPPVYVQEVPFAGPPIASPEESSNTATYLSADVPADLSEWPEAFGRDSGNLSANAGVAPDSIFGQRVLCGAGTSDPKVSLPAITNLNTESWTLIYWFQIISFNSIFNTVMTTPSSNSIVPSISVRGSGEPIDSMYVGTGNVNLQSYSSGWRMIVWSKVSSGVNKIWMANPSSGGEASLTDINATATTNHNEFYPNFWGAAGDGSQESDIALGNIRTFNKYLSEDERKNVFLWDVGSY